MNANSIVHTEYGAFCAVCQSQLSLEEEDFGVCDACGGEGIGQPDDDEPLPVERMSLGDWRRLMESTPGRLPTCGEMGRASEQCSSEWGWKR